MNCKPGDLAIVIGRLSENLGKIVEVVRRAAPGERISGFRLDCDATDICWLVRSHSSKLAWCTAGGVLLGYVSERAIGDEFLRPIRDQPGEDEMLRIAGLPNKLTEPA